MLIQKNTVAALDLIEDKNEKLRCAATEYAKEGLYVIPLRPGTKLLPKKSSGFSYCHSSNKIKTVNNWYKKGGKFEGFNIGISCGKEGGVFVLDVDVGEEKNGFQTLKDLGISSIDAPYQVTPSGGRHYFFNWEEGGKSTVEKIGPGLDTRGGTSEEFKGHVAVWPSTTETGDYLWEEYGEIKDCPGWLTHFLDTIQVPKKGRGNENIDQEQKEEIFPLSILQEMLDCIDPDNLNYEEWLNVGQALHSQHASAECLEMWDTWSQRGERYEERECSSRWIGFYSGGAIRIGTLLWMAQQEGYVLGKTSNLQGREGPIADVVREFNEEFAVISLGGKVRILAESHIHDPLRPPFQVMSQQDFNLYTAPRKIWLTKGDSDPKAVTKSSIWLADEDRRMYPNGLGMDPAQPREYQGKYNLWRGYTVTPQKGTWLKLKQHIHEVICKNDRDRYIWLMDWIADMFQDPSRPKGCAVVLQGAEGAGKGTLASVLGHIMGSHYRHVTKKKHLTGDFNVLMEGAVFVFADEVVYGGTKQTAGVLKAMVTEKEIIIERKGIDSVMMESYLHLMLASNEDWVIPAGAGSRRWFVLDVASHRANDRPWFNAIRDEMENGGYEGFLYSMLEREITSNLQKAPETEILLEQRRMYVSGNPFISWWEFAVEQQELGVADIDMGWDAKWPKYVIRADLNRAALAWVKEQGFRYNQGAHYMSKMMQKFGFIPVDVTPTASKARCYKVPTLEEAEESLLKLIGEQSYE